MGEPLVCCICLTKDRPGYLKQAVECFKSQTYAEKHLVILDTGNPFVRMDDIFAGLTTCRDHSIAGHSIGWLRNHCLEKCQWPIVPDRATIIAHWDDDDWSAPERLSDQVRHFRNNFEGISDYSGPRCMITGYHDLLFYDVEQDRVLFYESKMTGYAVGTSLMYRREVWERTPFPDQSVGEDAAWQHAVRREQGHAVVSTSSLVDGKPLMVARQHAGCASQKSEQPRSTIMWGQNYSTASPELESAVRLVVDTNLKVAHTS